MATLLIPLLILIPAFFDISVITIGVTFLAAFVAITFVHLFTLELECEEETWRSSPYG